LFWMCVPDWPISMCTFESWYWKGLGFKKCFFTYWCRAKLFVGVDA